MAQPGHRGATLTDELGQRFVRFAERECRGVSTLYERLALGIADDPELLAIAARARPDQPPPNLLLAAVHLLLLKGAHHPLAAYYPSISPSADPYADAFPAFRDFCLQQREPLIALLDTRIVQTNEVRRSACLLPAFGKVARRFGRPLALVELGASAGLNLLFDRYQFDYGDGRQYGDVASPVLIVCASHGHRVPPLPRQLPKVAWRVGLDLHPVDLRDPEEALWLRALVWPDHRIRAAVLERAIEVARNDPPRLLPGDALELLPEVLAEAPPDAALCVFHTHTLNQLDESARARLTAILEDHATHRDLGRVSIERLGTPEPPRLELVTYASGQRTEQHLANCDPHGGWIDWVAGDD
jgi:hypothetical protein